MRRTSLLCLLAFLVSWLATPNAQNHNQPVWAVHHAEHDSAGSVAHATICEPFNREGFARILPLTSSTIDSIGMAFSQHNTRVIKEADSLLQRGAFGPPQSRDAQKNCLLHFQLRAWNGIQSVAALAGRSGRVFAGEGDSILIPFRRDYVNAAVYPLQFLKRIQLGRNQFCVEYDAPVGYESHLIIGDERVRFRTFRTILPEKGAHLVLSRELLIADGKQVELLSEEIGRGRVLWEKIFDLERL